MPEEHDHEARRSTAAPPTNTPETDADIGRPRLTPQNRTDPGSSGEDATDPSGRGEKRGQGDTAEGER